MGLNKSTFSGRNDFGIVYEYEWQSKTDEKLDAKVVLNWWIRFVDTNLKLWEKRIGLVEPVKTTDVLPAGNEIKITAYKHYDFVKDEHSPICAQQMLRAFGLMVTTVAKRGDQDMLSKYICQYASSDPSMEKIRGAFCRDVVRVCI